MKTFGFILIGVGILLMIFRGLNITEKKKLVDLGPIEINKKERKSVGWPIYAGAITTIAGIVIVVAGKKKNS